MRQKVAADGFGFAEGDHTHPGRFEPERNPADAAEGVDEVDGHGRRWADGTDGPPAPVRNGRREETQGAPPGPA